MCNFEDIYLLAQTGDAEAQYQLGIMYSRGTGDVQKSYADSFEWLSKAAEQGHAKANYHLGSLYLHGDRCPMREDIVVCTKNESKARCYFDKAREAFEKDVGEGLLWLAAIYGKGLGVEANHGKSEELLKLAAEFGNDEAKKMLSSSHRGSL